MLIPVIVDRPTVIPASELHSSSVLPHRPPPNNRPPILVASGWSPDDPLGPSSTGHPFHPAIVLTGHRGPRKYVVRVGGVPIDVTASQLQALADLLYSRLKEPLGYSTIASCDGKDRSVAVRVLISRLRKRIDKQWKAATGHIEGIANQIIESGNGVEYRFAPFIEVRVEEEFLRLATSFLCDKVLRVIQNAQILVTQE